MKIGLAIIFISFIDSILNVDYEYDLEIGSSLYFQNLSTSYTYKFYVPAKLGQTINIEFVGSFLSTKYQLITIYEYPSRSSTTETTQTNPYMSYNSNQNSYSKSYTILFGDTKYVAFEINPYYSMSYVYAKANFIYKNLEYDLKDDFPKSFSTLEISNIYKFYIEVKYGQKVDIEITKSDTSTYEQNITFYEYSIRNAKNYITSQKRTLHYNSNKKSFSESYNLTTDSYFSSVYVAFEIIPYYEMQDVEVKACLKAWLVYEYNLTNGSSENFGTLSSSKFYKFYIPANFLQQVDLELYKSDSDYTYGQQIIIYEYSSRFSTTELRKKKTVIVYNSKKNIYSISYTIQSSSSAYLAIEINPFYSMSNVYARVNIITYVFNEYDLTSKSSMFFSSLSTTSISKFYIPAKRPQKLFIEITKSDSLSTSEQYITIFEYSTRSSTTELKKGNYHLTYNSTTNSYLTSYDVYDSSSSYIAFEINPYYEMESVYVNATVISPTYEYDLYIGSSQRIPTLYTTCIYKFYIYTQYGQAIDIEFKKSDSMSTSEQYITIYEYSSKSSTIELTKTNHSLSYDSTKNAYLCSYNVSHSSYAYVVFELIPYYEMESVYVKTTVISPIYEYDLNNGSSKYFPALLRGSTYKFYTPAKYPQILYIELFNFDSSSFFDKGDISFTLYEYSNRNSTTSLVYWGTYMSYNSTTNSYLFSYSISDTSSTFLAFEISPYYYEMESIYIKATVISPTYEYDLYIGSSQYFETLYTTCIYKFYINAQYGQSIVIELTKSDSMSTSEQILIIYEYSSKSSTIELTKTNYPFVYDSTKKAYFCSYYVSRDSTSYVAFEINPSYDMTSVNVKVTLEEEYSNFLDKVLHSKLLIPIILGICIFIIFIIICCCCYCRRKHKENEIDVKNSSIQPLLPLN